MTGRADNQTFASMALSALMSGTAVRLRYKLDPVGTFCFVDAIEVKS